MNRNDIINVFQQVLENPSNSFIEQWISDGGKVMGYYCSLIPPEIFTAAGITPYRIRAAGSDSTDLADVYVSSQLCTFVRHMLNLALGGQFDFLSGIVAMNGCDQARRAYDIWEKKTDIPFKTIISVPRTPANYNIEWFKEELKKLIKAIENHFSVKITPQSLAEAIKFHNTTRRKLAQFNDLRKEPDPPINGYEASIVNIAAQIMPLKDFNDLIDKLLQAVGKEKRTGRYRTRLIVSGGEMDEPEFVKIIEDQGGLVVYEDTCFGARYYEEPVSEEEDPLNSIANRYFYRIPCARMGNSFDRRYENLEKIYREFKAEGIISQILVHCILNSGFSFQLKRKAKTSEISTLLLDRECRMKGYGQMKTRVQAFIESIESKARKEDKYNGRTSK